jgi:hypothetical protein
LAGNLDPGAERRRRTVSFQKHVAARCPDEQQVPFELAIFSRRRLGRALIFVKRGVLREALFPVRSRGHLAFRHGDKVTSTRHLEASSRSNPTLANFAE